MGGKTYTAELGAAVTALGRSTLLLGVEVSQLAAGGLNDADFVGLGVVSVKKPIASAYCPFSSISYPYPSPPPPTLDPPPSFQGVCVSYGCRLR